MDKDSFIVCIKTEDLYANIAKDVEARIENSNYDLVGIKSYKNFLRN